MLKARHDARLAKVKEDLMCSTERQEKIRSLTLRIKDEEHGVALRGLERINEKVRTSTHN